MKRSTPMKRTRLQAVSKKTRVIRWPILRALRAYVLARAGYACQYCGAETQLDLHHVVKRSAGGGDTANNTVALCRLCHDRTDAEYRDGRLVIESLGWECFRMRLVFAQNKWAARASG